jgi:hypothetical protein
MVFNGTFNNISVIAWWLVLHEEKVKDDLVLLLQESTFYTKTHLDKVK